MRVITGSAKGFGLKASRHLKLRPTPSRVKEALFSSLAEKIPSAIVLELFAGTGAFGIETLSRGAVSATLVEKDPRAASIIKENLLKTHLEGRARLLRTDVRQALEWLDRDKATFTLIFADPPYQKGKQPKSDELDSKNSPTQDSNFSWLKFLLNSKPLSRLLTKEGVLLIEHFKKEVVPQSPYFQLLRQFRFGDTAVGVFCVAKN